MWKTLVATTSLIAVLAMAGSTAAVPTDGMPGPSWYGLCTAWHAFGGNDNPGNAPNAGPFAWLQEQAEEEDMSVSDWCAANTEHPSNNGNGNGPGDNNGPPGP